MVARILPYFPPHRTYVEPFAGGASLFFAKEPSPVEVLNDLDSGLINLYRVLRDPEQFKEFHRLVVLTPYSREEYNHCYAHWRDYDDPVKRAWAWFVMRRMAFSAHHSWGYSLTASCRGMAMATSRWLTTIDHLPEIHLRLSRIQIDHDDFRKVLRRYDTPETLFYCDPPYVPDTRRSGGYEHELTLEDHQDLVDILLSLKGMVILSGYNHQVYQPLEDAGWQRHDFYTACYAAGRTRLTGIQGEGSALKLQPRIESLWLSPHTCP